MEFLPKKRTHRPTTLAALKALDAQKAPATPQPDATPVLDSAGFADAEFKLGAASAVQAWAATSPADLAPGETLIDLLIGILAGISAPDIDAEMTTDQSDVATAHLHMAADYMQRKGVAESDILAMLNEDDIGAAERIHEYLAAEFAAEDGLDDLHGYVFDAGDQVPMLDSVAVLDAVYKKTAVIRGGRKLMVNRRISGSVKLSSAQKVAIRRAQLKSHSSGAKMARAKSLRMRASMGL